MEGYENKSGKRFRYRCRKAVLATGTTDLSNHLGVSGESTHPNWVTHDLNDLETRLEGLVEEHGTYYVLRTRYVLRKIGTSNRELATFR